MDEVDAEVGEEQKQWELEEVIIRAGLVAEGVVEFGVASYFGKEEWGGEDGNEGHAVYRLGDFHFDLVLEEFGVLEGGFVEDEDVRKGRDNEVD